MARTDKKGNPPPGMRAPEAQKTRKFPNLTINMPQFDEPTEAEQIARAAQASTPGAVPTIGNEPTVTPPPTLGAAPTVSAVPTDSPLPTGVKAPTVSTATDQPTAKPTVGAAPRVGEAPAVRLAVEAKRGHLRVPNHIIFNLLPQLELAERAVYIELYAWTHGFGEAERRLSIAKLCKSLRIDYKRFIRIVTELTSKGLVEMNKRVIDGPRDDRGTIFRVFEPLVIGTDGGAPTPGAAPTVGAKPIMKGKSEKHEEKAPVALAPVPGVLSVYDVRTIAARFRELHHGEADYTKERLKSDVRTALIGEGREPDERLIDDAIG